jgi:hypothetical protein
MKFLVIGKLKDSALMMPPSVLLQIAEASVASMKQQQKEGKLLEYYYSPAMKKEILILNVDNADQWAADQDKIPIIPFMDVEAYPLADGWKSIQNTVENIKMMASAPK